MREFKFRDYDMDNKELRYFDMDSYNRQEHDAWGNMMQFTGLKDSCKNDIYEGDIIHEISIGTWHSVVNRKYVIEFIRQDLGDRSEQQTIGWNATPIISYKRETEYGNKGISSLCINHPGITCVVIGNIHQNPELLK